MFDYSQISRVSPKIKILSPFATIFLASSRTLPHIISAFGRAVQWNRASNYFVSDTLAKKRNTALYRTRTARIGLSLKGRIFRYSNHQRPHHDKPGPNKYLTYSNSATKAVTQRLIHHQESNLGFVFINASSTGFFANQHIQCDIAYLTK